LQRYFQSAYEIFLGLQKAESEKNMKAGVGLIESLTKNKGEFEKALGGWHQTLADTCKLKHLSVHHSLSSLSSFLKTLVDLQQARCYTGINYEGEISQQLEEIKAAGFTLPRIRSKLDKLDGAVENVRKLHSEVRGHMDHMAMKMEFYSSPMDSSVAAFHMTTYKLLSGIASCSFDHSSSPSAPLPHSSMVEGTIRNCIISLLSRTVNICNVTIPLATVIVKVVAAWGALNLHTPPSPSSSSSPSPASTSQVVEEFALDVSYLMARSYEDQIARLSINGASAFGEAVVVRMVALFAMGQIDLTRHISEQLVVKLSLVDSPRNPTLQEFSTITFQHIKLHYPSRIQTKDTEEFIKQRWMQVFQVPCPPSSPSFIDWDEYDLVQSSGWSIPPSLSRHSFLSPPPSSSQSQPQSQSLLSSPPVYGNRIVQSKAMLNMIVIEMGWRKMDSPSSSPSHPSSSSSSSRSISNIDEGVIKEMEGKLANAITKISDQDHLISKLKGDLEKVKAEKKEMEMKITVELQNATVNLQAQINKINFAAAAINNAEKTATIRLTHAPPIFSAPTPVLNQSSSSSSSSPSPQPLSNNNANNRGRDDEDEDEDEDDDKTESIHDGDDDQVEDEDGDGDEDGDYIEDEDQQA
jgi:hypothetical protein